jgi:ADP-heptose:LPS heptosyltransferase
MINLPSVTAVIIDTHNHQAAISAIVKTLRIINPAKLLFLTDMEITVPGAEVIKIEPIKSKAEYSQFCIKKLNQYIGTEHVLLFQWDGFPINGKAWNDDFLKYDYIGAPFDYDHERQVGNGGFSLRSKRLHTVLAEDNFIDILHPEDQSICIIYRWYLEKKYNVKFAPRALAEQFAYECVEPTVPTFGFHNFAGRPYKPCVIVRRTGALGDVIAVEPVLEYYYKQGYRVFLDTLPDFYLLFCQHRYNVEYAQHINPRMPYTFVDLDMAYEAVPKQLHLQSYYEKAGIADGEIKRPTLYMDLALKDRMFKNKTAVIHYNKRPQGGRNIYDVDWDSIVSVLNAIGYDVIQVGLGEHVRINGAMSIHTASTNLLQYVVASCDLFIGADSGVSHIAVAHGIPSVIFFGNVKAEYIHPDLSNVCVIEHENVCDKPKCWHELVSTEGQPCYIDESKPPCATFDTETVISKIHEFINRQD